MEPWVPPWTDAEQCCQGACLTPLDVCQGKDAPASMLCTTTHMWYTQEAAWGEGCQVGQGKGCRAMQAPCPGFKTFNKILQWKTVCDYWHAAILWRQEQPPDWVCSCENSWKWDHCIWNQSVIASVSLFPKHAARQSRKQVIRKTAMALRWECNKKIRKKPAHSTISKNPTSQNSTCEKIWELIYGLTMNCSR